MSQTPASDPSVEVTDQAPNEPATGPRPTPGPRPIPAPRPTPAALASLKAPRPSPRPNAPTAPAPSAAATHAATFGQVGEDGTVSVVEAAGTRVVGQVPDSSPDEALTLYVRRFLDLEAKVVLFEARLAATDLSIKEIDQTLTKLTEELVEPAAVGDLDGLRARLDGLREVAAQRTEALEAERAQARAATLQERTAIVEQAEAIAATEPERMQWRPAGEQLRQLLDAWKQSQRSGPRLDRATEDGLWKRFSQARTSFDRERRHHFAELENRTAQAKAAKEALVVQAEELASSTDWGQTSAIYRDLMSQWKAAGRATRGIDDELWARFRAAQDQFFAARDAQAALVDAEYQANLEVKLRLLKEAEALVPVTDTQTARNALRSIQTKWEAAGRVPRSELQGIESRLRAVETAIREHEDAHWRRSNPEMKARAQGMLAQLIDAVAGLERDLAKAEQSGNSKKVAEIKTALDARRVWLAQAERTAAEHS